MYAQWVKRRQFMQTLAASTPLLLDAELLAGQDPWNRVRDLFMIPRDRIYLNVGTLGAQPRTVVHATEDATRRVAESLPPGVPWDAIKQKTAALIDCDPAGLVFPRNTTESMNFIANGLDYREGDHIITTNHEHIGGLSCWELVAARFRLQLTQVNIGTAPTDPEEVFARIKAAITPRTRVISISHVNFTTGFIMPVRPIVELCRQRGIISVIDGAHPPGLMAMSVRQLDPDFYAGSPHKWLLAPQGTGLLWMREEWRTKLWPSVASGDWNKKELGAHRFNHMGTLDESRFTGLLAALEFFEIVGPSRIYARIEQLRHTMLSALADIRGIQLATPHLYAAGMVSFKHPRISSLDLQKKLAEKNIRTRVISEYNYGWMRLSAHVYNTVDELARVVELIAAA